ncbi:hypothetical protein LBMAG56_02350 [Verrucomicrobiota bacterium]|nr:hypothetical protein LBMAG56_02350 [Verrucomicrobiota bacterium]
MKITTHSKSPSAAVVASTFRRRFLNFAFVFGLAAVFAAVAIGRAQEAKLLLHERPLPAIAAPDFKGPLDASFSVAKGKWTPQDGVLRVLDLPEEKHIPVLHHNVGLAAAVIEVEFLIEGPGSFLVGCDADKHVGRVVVTPTALGIAEDSVKPSHTIARLPLPVKPGEWHRLRVEWKGDQMAANLDGHELRAQHAFLATPKARSWLAAGKSVQVRNLKISGEKTPAKP